MNADERAARVAHEEDWDDDGALRVLIQKQIEEAVAEEREACARFLEETLGDSYLADKIRARGQSGQE